MPVKKLDGQAIEKKRYAFQIPELVKIEKIVASATTCARTGKAKPPV
ncbi:MAG: hypothetical protein JWM16_5563 [Verrucomicrobiales bacterium]|nr:hypothetical protein [Verrucomicrobiales bacterium]